MFPSSHRSVGHAVNSSLALQNDEGSNPDGNRTFLDLIILSNLSFLTFEANVETKKTKMKKQTKCACFLHAF